MNVQPRQYIPRMLLLLLASIASAQPVPRALCFPAQNLPAHLRAKSDELLLRVLDSEALYTVIGGLKPMSGGVPAISVRLDHPDLTSAAEARQIMEAWSCGDGVRFALHHYARVLTSANSSTPPARTLSGVVFHRAAMARTISRHPSLFTQLGLTPNADPVEVLMAVEYNGTPDRYRGYGILFGYPEQAVEFFVANTPIPQDRKANPNEPVEVQPVKTSPRKFISIPTYAHETGAFVYAVPTGHVEDSADHELRERAKPILESYKRRRALYIGEGKPGAAALLRDWFCRGEYDCQPSNATLDPPPATTNVP
jgi:hypothetical protein